MSVPREIAIAYGSLTMGAGTSYPLHSYWTSRTDFETSEIGWKFLVTGTSAAAFAAACIAVEGDLRKPYKDLTVTQGGTAILTLSQSSNTGLDAQPEISKEEDPLQTGRSRLYKVVVRAGRPADNVDNPGLRRLFVSVEYDPSRRRTVRFSGTYTAKDSNTARAQYEAQIAGLVSTKLTSLGGTYELVGEPVTRETTNNKTLDFERVHRERVTGQAGSSLDDASLVDSKLSVSKKRVNNGNSPDPSAAELTVVVATFSCAVDKTVTTDIGAKYAQIRGNLLSRIASLAGSTLAVTEDEVRLDPENNSIDVTIIGLGRDDDSKDLIFNRVTVLSDGHTGVRFVPRWNQRPFAAYVYQGPALKQYVITQSGRYWGKKQGRTVEADTLSIAKRSWGGKGVLVSHNPSLTNVVHGVGSNTIEYTDYECRTIFRFIDNGETSDGGGAGGGAGGGGGPGSGEGGEGGGGVWDDYATAGSIFVGLGTPTFGVIYSGGGGSYSNTNQAGFGGNGAGGPGQ